MGFFSKKDKQNDNRRTSDEAGGDTAADSIDLDGRLGMPEDVAMNSLDYLDDTGELLARSAPTITSQDGATGGGWHMPDVEGVRPEADLGSDESFTTFFGDDPEASSDLESIVPNSYQVDPAYPEANTGSSVPQATELPPSPEATAHFADHDRRLDDLPPMAAAGTSELAAQSDFLAVEIDDIGQPVDDFGEDRIVPDMPPEFDDDPFAPPPGLAAPLLGQPAAPTDWEPAAEAPTEEFAPQFEENFAEENFSDEHPVDQHPVDDHLVDENLDYEYVPVEQFTEEPLIRETVLEEEVVEDSRDDDDMAGEWVGMESPEPEEVDMAALALATSAQQGHLAPAEPAAEPMFEPAAAPLLSSEPMPVDETGPISIDVHADGPIGSRAETLLEILGLDTTATWTQIGETHRELSVELHQTTDGDPAREAVSRAIQREMNTAYAALRLMAVG